MRSPFNSSKIWITLDVEELKSSNFDLGIKNSSSIDYDKLIQNWIEICNQLNILSTCFILGEFAQKFPYLVKKLHEHGHEIASHGMDHRLVNKMTISDWEKSIVDSKNLLENITGKKIYGYRSASWSMPSSLKYYEILAKNGYKYSSSYFPFKTYMYGNSEDKKDPFTISTSFGDITEIPIPKFLVPFSGGFYFRVLPIFILKLLFNKIILSGHKPVFYIHPYELDNNNLLKRYIGISKFNLDYLLAFFSTSNVMKKIFKVLKE